MARPLRIEVPGAIYHLTSRGNAREAVFLDNEDRRAFLAALGEVVERCGWLCHAYCLMGNHYHLLAETPASTPTCISEDPIGRERAYNRGLKDAKCSRR